VCEKCVSHSIGINYLSLQDSSSHDKDVNNIEGGDGMPVEYNRREMVKFRQENCVENDVWDEKFEVIFWYGAATYVI
jgi:chemotaxis methyl-accepting protein methylase